MAVSSVGSATNGSSGSTAISCTHGLTILAGDFVTAWINSNWTSGTPTIADNNGATPFTVTYGERGYNGNSAFYKIFQRVAGASEPAAYAFTLSQSERWAIIIHVARGVNTASPWNVTPSATTENLDDASPYATDSIVTTVNGCLAIVAAFLDSATATFSATPADSFTMQQNNSGEQLIALSDKAIPTATTQASVSWSSATGSAMATQAVALAPMVGSTHYYRMNQ